MFQFRFVIVGDVHGMLAGLEALLDRVSLQKSDTLVMAGDLLDRGPDSAGVVSCLWNLTGAGYKVVLVKNGSPCNRPGYRRCFRRLANR